MADKSQELALALLKEAKGKGTLDPSIEKELAGLIGTEERPKVKEALEAKEGKPVDAAELVNKLELEAQYSERLNTLKHYGFLDESGEAKEGNVKVPTYEEAMATFKPEELEIASNFQKPTLLLIPETSFEAKVKAMDAHKQGMQENNTYVNEIYSETDSGSDKITGWRAAIVDGAQEMKAYEGDKLDLRFDKRIEARKATRKEGEKGMDRHRYALLMMEAIKNGNPVDKELYTLLDDDSALSDSNVPGANFYPAVRRVRFYWYDPDGVSGDARFRSSVGGDVLLS
ncbi:hypothetical protein KJ836_03740 [Patescibacteria group bacterium]|nr:hypothetical protein [Patescibacteria group bacterium]